MAETLLESIKDGDNQRRVGVIKIITEASPMLRYLPFIEVKGNAYSYEIEQSLPTVAFRGVGGTYVANTGVINPVTERLAIVGGEVKIDNFQVHTQGNLRDVLARQYAMKARSIAITFSEKFIEGDANATPNEFNGIRRRLASNTPQIVSLASGGATLTLNDLDQLIDAVIGSGDGNVHLFGNKTLRRKITELARDHSGHPLLEVGKDPLVGHQLTMYNGVPYHIVERDDDQSTFLDFDEDDTGAGGNLDSASIYCVRFGDEFVAGLRGAGSSLEVKDFGEIQSEPAHMGRIEAYWGLAIHHPRSVARLRFINNS